MIENDKQPAPAKLSQLAKTIFYNSNEGATTKTIQSILEKGAEWQRSQLAKGKITFSFPCIMDKETKTRFEGYLTKNVFPFKCKKLGAQSFEYSIQIDEVVNAFWIGANFIGISYNIFNS